MCCIHGDIFMFNEEDEFDVDCEDNFMNNLNSQNTAEAKTTPPNT